MPKTLFLISQSPNSAVNLSNALKLIAPEDAVCFIQDGVYFSNKSIVPENLSKDLSKIEKNDVKIFHLEPDLEARGLSFDGEKVDYDGLLDLIEKYDNIYH